ncbi:hypothetical protein MTR62_09535 [Novosphingobium sp. 1949]|uniref:Uncharacterized protein n=1 Tax=Novosphingobium organovorum TaxID=2930092 RepID=A0ABT0BCZ1_9SPHN|nr:hypothetical protein [Novosphingobium organovorum]MCJ2182931.1 hypothetical protein [Novosphingobium organovorum]
MAKHTLAAAVALAGLSLIALPASVQAHGVTKPQHGGVVQMNGETLFELVREPGGTSLYLIDEDEPVAASSMSAKLDISNHGKKSEVPLTPGKGNQFFKKGLTIAAGSSVAVQVVDKASGVRYGTTFLIK